MASCLVCLCAVSVDTIVSAMASAMAMVALAYCVLMCATFVALRSQVVVLYVDEETSVRRQLSRALAASAHNRRVLDAGGGQLHEERSTDVSSEKVSTRWLWCALWVLWQQVFLDV